jgi:putative molybdopterin biosynthesis protein
MISGAKLRSARQARGYSQQQLAGMAGVSRQAVSAVESGQSDPSLRVALTLAQALGMTVEELFGADSQAAAVAARLVGDHGRAGTRVTLAPIAESLVAFSLSGTAASRAGFRAAGGLIAAAVPQNEPALAPGEAPEVHVSPIGPPRPTLIVAGCDPALPLLEEPLSLLDPPIAFSWWPCPSEEALKLAARGLVHAAGVHLSDGSGTYNTEPAAKLLPRGGEVVGFTGWREGLVLAPCSDDGITGVADAVSRGLRFVNREPGAEARRLLDRQLARAGIDRAAVIGYATAAAGHLQLAEAIAAGLADVGVACEPAALAYGLAFIPLASERFDLVIPATQAASREVQALIRVLSSRWLLDQLASLPGYDPSSCGQHVATLACST